MNPSRLHSLLTCLSRALQNEQRRTAVAGGLLPVQWSILTYLRDANRYSNTPQALAEYLALTKGTLSQSLKLLEARGLIHREPDAHDRRVLRLRASAAGLAALADESERQWHAAIADLPENERDAAERALAQLLRTWQKNRQGRSFGVCRSCRHFGPGSEKHRCGLTGEALTDADSARICREHQEP